LGGFLGYGPATADQPAKLAPKEEKLRDTLLVLDQQFWEAASKHDVNTLDRLIAVNYTGIGGEGTHWNKQSILEQHRQFRTAYLQITSEKEVVRVSADAAM